MKALRFSRMMIVGLVAVLALALGAVAQAAPDDRLPGASLDSPAPQQGRDGSCAVIRVDLNGDKGATKTCLAEKPVGPGAETQSNGTTFCLSSDLILFEHEYFGGARICFYGTGFANLKDYGLFLWFSWDNAMSSFASGSQGGKFYDGMNGNYSSFSFGPGQQHRTLGWWNERASSLCLGASCP